MRKIIISFLSLCLLTLMSSTFSTAKEKDIWMDVTEKLNPSLSEHLPSMPKEAPHPLPQHKGDVNFNKVFFASQTGCEIYFHTDSNITVRATERGYIELLGIDNKGFKETIGFRMSFLRERKDHKPIQMAPRGIIEKKCIPLMDKLPSPYKEKFNKEYNQREKSGFQNDTTSITSKLFQIGSLWDRKDIFSSSADLPLQRILNTLDLAVGTEMGTETYIFLGNFSGTRVAATNYHVNFSTNKTKILTFKILSNRNSNISVKAKIGKIIGAWKEIDLKLVTLEKTTNPIKTDDYKNIEILDSFGKNFSFNSNILLDMPLAIVGFGIENRKTNSPTVEWSNDCKVLSKDNDFRKMSDPDRTASKLYYRVWSFATGCDASHGDSGAPVIDRRTGDILGLLWTVGTTKNKEIRSSPFIQRLDVNLHDNLIWTQFTYIIPAPMIKKVLQGSLKDLKTNDKKVVEAILGLTPG